MDSNIINENETVEISDFEKFKRHLSKHKKKYIFGGVATVSFVLGLSLGNRGNSKRHYSKLLKDGVKDAVMEGMKDVVETGMKDVVKDGMKRVVTDVVTDTFEDVIDTVKDTVRDSVKKAIKESAVTITKEVEVLHQSKSSLEYKDKYIDLIKRLIDQANNDSSGLTFRYDSDGNIYSTKS